MSPAMEELYQYFVGHPNPRHWPDELRDRPVLGHGQYAFSEGCGWASCSSKQQRNTV